MERLLPKIDSPADLKKLTWEELDRLAAEIREEITNVVSRNGGHLSSNLGVVELTMALVKSYDFPQDKLIFDVGHQVYTYKLLTGRRDGFATIRTDGGISGFPCPAEGPYDTFTEGHAGAALSQAMGLVAGNHLEKSSAKVIALVGDGSMTAGMALEALNNASHLSRRFMVVLNDNNMSISKSVGALANYLNRVRVGSAYNEFKRDLRALLRRVPVFGSTMEQAAGELRDTIARAILPGQFFEQIGFAYFGPYDGHNIKLLCETFAEMDRLPLDKPIIVHVVTEKGRGFEPAEEDPAGYHSSGPFVRRNGKAVAPSEDAPVTYTDIFSEALVKLGRRDRRVVAITAAMPDGTGTIAFGREFPQRFFDVAICEQHAVGMAAGLARAGLVPVVAIYSTFLQRSYDQIFHEIALQCLPCVFCLDRAGIVGADGPTHHGLFDISYMRTFPGITVMAPADAAELKGMLRFAVDLGRPVAIRYPRGNALEASPAPVPAPAPIRLGRAVTLREGTDATIISYGTTAAAALDAAAILARENISVSVINARFAKPLDEETILAAARRGPVVTTEEHALIGGFGAAVVEMLADRGVPARVARLGVPDAFLPHGARSRLLATLSLDAAGIAATARALVAERSPAARERTIPDATGARGGGK